MIMFVGEILYSVCKRRQKSLANAFWVTGKEYSMGTVLVGAIVVAIAGLAIRSIVKDKKSAKGCNGNCGSCGGLCH